MVHNSAGDGTHSHLSPNRDRLVSVTVWIICKKGKQFRMGSSKFNLYYRQGIWFQLETALNLPFQKYNFYFQGDF